MDTQRPNPANFVHLLACGFGSGLIPKAPGTWGTFAAMLLWWPLSFLPWLVYCLILLVAIVAGVWLCDRTASDLQTHDHPAIVWDEFCGYWITMILAPHNLIWAIYGFVLFRIFDIWKPFPIRQIDKHVHGGLGIMADDLIAGIFSALLLQLTSWLINMHILGVG